VSDSVLFISQLLTLERSAATLRDEVVSLAIRTVQARAEHRNNPSLETQRELNQLEGKTRDHLEFGRFISAHPVRGRRT